MNPHLMLLLRRLAVLAALAACLLGLAACGEKDDRVSAPSTQKVRLMLDYLPNADHAGIYEAIADGAFRRAGLDVEPIVPPDPAAPLKLLAAGRADVAISYEPEVLLARDKGLKIVSIGALVQRPLTSIMALPKSKVRSVNDLQGKTIGTAGIPYQSAYLKTILAGAGVPQDSVKEVNVNFNLIPAMLSGRADATLGAFWNVEGVQLQREKRHPVIIPVDRAGVPTYNELVLVVREQDARARGPYLRAFLRALAQGHEALRKNPEAGVRALVARNRDLNPDTTLAQVRATLPAFFPADETKPFGWQDQGAWGRYGRWMLDNRLLAKAPLPTSLTNEYLPGVGLEQDGPPS